MGLCCSGPEAKERNENEPDKKDGIELPQLPNTTDQGRRSRSMRSPKAHGRKGYAAESETRKRIDVEAIKINFTPSKSDAEPISPQLTSRADSERDIVKELGQGRGHHRKRRGIPNPKERRTSLSEFQLLRQLGTGAYGKVVLVKREIGDDTGSLYALKVMERRELIFSDVAGNIKSERDILALVDHPFIIKLKYSWQTKTNLFLVMDYMPGGDLLKHLLKVKRFPEELVRVYSAEVAAALGYLHRQGYLYRDLKPENVLVASDGHLKLSDFGLSRPIQRVDDTPCHENVASPHYKAPELVENDPDHGTAVDWWALGVFIYELTAGRPPFQYKDDPRIVDEEDDEYLMQLEERILKDEVGFVEVDGVEVFSPQCVDLVTSLMVKDPDKRMCSKRQTEHRRERGGVRELKKHKYYAGLDWVRMVSKDVEVQMPLPQSNVEVENDQKVYISPGEELPEGLTHKYIRHRNFTYNFTDEDLQRLSVISQSNPHHHKQWESWTKDFQDAGSQSPVSKLSSSSPTTEPSKI